MSKDGILTIVYRPELETAASFSLFAPEPGWDRDLGDWFKRSKARYSPFCVNLDFQLS
jgi:hypothetical protein